ncbi:DNA polymerase [Coemansia reversa NRRL 1564]|uniref:Probable DNA polymerase n=1 Tax=Coemansia reversa (strain ATCC 12441 / NRRL 1564) TaxID=763665 RepID=A0A2G5B0L9_COERN|nr:DNA polymerase [Coemansia reversa NRRL 1564]|eukprot:PIA12563.1 DNA polymerase [Coemansia reversa NRRL 1564]
MSEYEFMRRGMSRIDRSTPSVHTMEITRDEMRLEQTLEYLQLKNELWDKMDKREITADDARKQLDEEIGILKKVMDRRRKRDSKKKVSSTRKKVEKDYETLRSKGWDKRNIGMEVIEEKHLVQTDLISVYIPSESEFMKHSAQMKKAILERQKNPLEKPEHYCMASVQICGKNIFVTKTSLTPVLTPDGDPSPKFFEKLCEKVVECLRRTENYEERSEDITCNRVLMTYTISQWESVRNWYPDHDGSSTKIFKDFTVFLAPNEKVNCQQQCVEELNKIYHGENFNVAGVWDPKKKLEAMIPQKKVITYIPCQGDIRYVKELDDLMTSYQENIANTDCKNIARLIKWNDHMAVITKIKTTRKRNRVQRRRAINTDISDTLEEEQSNIDIFVDIEAFGKTYEDNYAEQVPYLVCWADGNDIYNAYGEDCMKEFVDQILNKYDKEITLWAWYGSGYDYQHIYPYLKAKCTYDICKLRNNSIIYARFDFERLKLKIHLKDPYLFILTSLDKAAKAFGVINKGNFPHTVIEGFDDLNRVLENWISEKSRTVSEQGNKIIKIYTETWNEFEKIQNYKTILEKAIEYCTIDVIAMQQIWKKFSNLVQEKLAVEITTEIFTLSQLSMRIMEACLPTSVWLFIPDRPTYEFIHDAIYGGRVIAKNGEYREPILYADAVSLYPSAMKLLEHGYGRPIKVNRIEWKRHGIYEVTLIHRSESEPKNYMEFVPRRIDKKLKWNWFKEHRGVYHTYDLLIAKEEGFDIICHRGIEYSSKGYIFNNYIEQLYKLKEKHSFCDCAGSSKEKCPIRMVAKIALNGGGYGKFVQKPIDTETYIVRRDIIAGECDRLEENKNGEIFFGGTLIKRPIFHHLDGNDYDKMIFTHESEPHYSTQNGISILSGSRYRLYKLCKQFPGMKVIYSDTDSVFIKANSINIDKFRSSCGTKLGQLDDSIDNTENITINYMIIGGPKMYAYEYYDKNGERKTNMHCKGIPTKMLDINHFKHIIDSEDNTLSYKFAIMKRRIVGVKTDIIDKTIMQT